MSKDNLKSKKSTKLHIRQRRVFSTEFKRQKVAEISSGKISIADFAKLWDIRKEVVYRWIMHILQNIKKGRQW